MSSLPTLLTNAQSSRYRALKRSKTRKQEGLFLLEGIRLCEEAFNSGLDITACITSKNFDRIDIPQDIERFDATPVQIEQIADSKSPQGIICVARIPDPPQQLAVDNTKTLLVLDRISDPGNMGTIFRSALWFGVNDILLGPDCVDPYGPKVVRGSMGAIGALNLHVTDDLLSSAERWKAEGGEVVALHMQGSSLQSFKNDKPLFLIIGSEAHGVDEKLLGISTALSIEQIGAGESLNAAMATGIALYALTQQ